MNQIKYGAVLNYVVIALNTIVGLVYTPYMLRVLGQNEYGLYSLVASVINYLTILDFGFGNAIVRYTAKFRTEGKLKEQWEMFGMFLIIYSLIGIVAFCGGLSLYFNIDVLFDRTMSVSDIAQARAMMLLLTFNLAFTFPLSVFGSIISAYENFVFQRIINIIRIVISTAVMILVLSIGYKAVALVVVQTVFNLMTLLVNYLYCKYKLKIQIIFRKIDWSFVKEISIYSFWIFLNAIVDRIYWGSGQIVLGSLCGTIAVAIFSVAITLQQMYMSFSSAISSVMLPQVTRMVSQHKSYTEISNKFILTGRIQFLIISLILSGFIIFGKYFIDIWAGAGYGTAYYITLIFFVALFIPTIQSVGVSILQARNELKFRSLSYVVISVISLIGQVYLTRYYGALGCALAIGLALLLGQGVVMNFYYRCYQKIDIKGFWINIYQMGIPLIFPFGIGLLLRYFIDLTHPLSLCIGIIIYTLIFLFFVYRYSMNNYEKTMILQLIKIKYKYDNKKNS